jgi:serine-type D-Ala-D-Ala carboxypeptidase
MTSLLVAFWPRSELLLTLVTRRRRGFLYPILKTCYNPIIAPKHLTGFSSSDKRLSFSVNFPAPAFEDQDRIFARPFDLIVEAIAARAFPCASVAVTQSSQLIALQAFGNFTFEPDTPTASVDTIFDLASVSKVVATTAAAMILYERGELDVEIPVSAIIAEFLQEDPRKDEVTLHMLLAHSSGLPAYEKLFRNAHSREELLRAALATPLVAEPGAFAVYSDIGFIILGEALSRIADEPLDRFCQHEVFGPLGMAHTMFKPPAAIRQSIPPTVNDESFRHRIVQGEVHDENASVLEGVAGHAGVFATASDVAIFAHSMLNGGRPLVRPETLSLFTRREIAPEGTSRALGWDTPSPPSQAGKYFSEQSFGHLGYTGTSLWIDPSRQLSVTLLTNRTWPDNQSQAIKRVRPLFHDAVVEALEKRS